MIRFLGHSYSTVLCGCRTHAIWTIWLTLEKDSVPSGNRGSCACQPRPRRRHRVLVWKCFSQTTRAARAKKIRTLHEARGAARQRELKAPSDGGRNPMTLTVRQDASSGVTPSSEGLLANLQQGSPGEWLRMHFEGNALGRTKLGAGLEVSRETIPLV